LKNFQTMQSFTDKAADDLFCEAFNVEIPKEIPDCYEGLLKRQELFDQAREMEAAAKDIRKEFQRDTFLSTNIGSTYFRLFISHFHHIHKFSTAVSSKTIRTCTVI